MDKSNIIFDLTNNKNIYKGILFAELDYPEIEKQSDLPFPNYPGEFCVGVMGIIWIDEDGIWNSKIRIKFPSGNKQVIFRKYDKEKKENININETYVLNKMYKFPMKNKNWLKNETGTGEGILELIKKANMIEYHRIVEE